jgi:hypothetical protein
MHDAAEFMLGWDCIAPLKAELGEPFRILDAGLQAASLTDLRRTLGIEIAPLLTDPLAPRGFAPSRAVAAAGGAEAVHGAPASAPPRRSFLADLERTVACGKDDLCPFG